jgi:hypothetical protein
MTLNLRLGLTIFLIGFAVESAGGFATLFSGSGSLPLHGYLPIVSLGSTTVGFVFLFIGRREWNDLHRARLHFAGVLFAASLATVGAAAAPVIYLVYAGSTPVQAVLGAEFGLAIAASVALTFATYTLVAAHLVGRVGEVAIGLGVGWAVVVAVEIGDALAPRLGGIARAAAAHPFTLPPELLSVGGWEAWLAFSYLAFFLAFLDAHYQVARGIGADAPG